MSLILTFPTATLTHSSLINSVDRGSTLETSEDNVAAVGIQKESSIQVDSSSEKLVDIENNLETDVESTVSLEKNIGWDFQGSNEKSKLISKGQSEQFFVNTKGVSPSENRGNYTVKSVDGSFYISSIRTVEFISGGFEATVGSNSSVALIKNTDANGEPLNVSGSRIYPSSSYSYSSNDTSVANVSERENCSNSLKQKGSCPVYVKPISEGEASIELSNSVGTSDSVIVKVTSSPVFIKDVRATQEPIEGQSSVKIKVFAQNDGPLKSGAEVRVNPEFTSSSVKTYSGISQNNTASREFVFPTQSGDAGDYAANAELFEKGNVGGRTIDSESTTYSILDSGPGIIVEGLDVSNEDGTVNETETIEFKVQVKNSASTTETGTVEVFNNTIGSNSTSVTLNSGQQSNVFISLDTQVGDRGSPVFTSKTDRSSTSNNFDIKRVVPKINEFIVTNTNATGRNSDVTYKLKSNSVRNKNISNVRLNLTINGNTKSVLLIDNGSATGNEDGGGPIKDDAQQVQTDNAIIIDSPAKIKKGDNIESKLIVTQSDGFKKTNTTFRTIS